MFEKVYSDVCIKIVIGR